MKTIGGLKMGDRIRIVSLPASEYMLHADTKRAYRKLIARGRSVRISRIDEYGQPWFEFKFRLKKGWEWHSMAVMEGDGNWVKVKRRTS